MRWRSTNTNHQVQGLSTWIPQKTGAPDALNVAPDVLRRASGTPLMASCTCSRRAPDAPTLGPVSHPHSVQWEGELHTSLGTGPDAPRWVRCLTLGTSTRWPKSALTGHANSGSAASGACIWCCLSTKTSSNHDLSKIKFGSLDLRTLSELPSARFTKCAPHLNLMPCLGQTTRSMPPLIVWSKEKQSPKLL